MSCSARWCPNPAGSNIKGSGNRPLSPTKHAVRNYLNKYVRKIVYAQTMINEKRFWSKVVKLPDNGCWLWTSAKSSHGYGYFGVDGKTKSVHRLAYQLINGPIPDGLQLDHTCHNDTDCNLDDDCPHRACCNPDHLEPVTGKVNFNRGDRHKKPRKTHCPKGHEYTPENTHERINSQGALARTCRTCNRLRVAAIRAK